MRGMLALNKNRSLFLQKKDTSRLTTLKAFHKECSYIFVILDMAVVVRQLLVNRDSRRHVRAKYRLVQSFSNSFPCRD